MPNQTLENKRSAFHLPGPEDVENLSDEEILARLSSFGITIDRPEFEQQCRSSVSIDYVLKHFTAKHDLDGEDSDWTFVCLWALWNRWCPDAPLYIRMTQQIDAATNATDAGDYETACQLWREAWREAHLLLEKTGLTFMDELDAQMDAAFSSLGLLEGFALALGHAGLKNPALLQERISVCQRGIELIDPENEETEELIDQMREAIAQSYFHLGDFEKADALYRNWLNENADVRIWLSWSGCYQFDGKARDLKRSEEILKEGLSRGNENDLLLLERLKKILEMQNHFIEAEALHRKIESLKRSRKSSAIKSGKGSVKVSRPVPANTRLQVGRKEPCPCGSGKKFKRCCGKQ